MEIGAFDLLVAAGGCANRSTAVSDRVFLVRDQRNLLWNVTEMLVKRGLESRPTSQKAVVAAFWGPLAPFSTARADVSTRPARVAKARCRLRPPPHAFRQTTQRQVLPSSPLSSMHAHSRKEPPRTETRI